MYTRLLLFSILGTNFGEELLMAYVVDQLSYYHLTELITRDVNARDKTLPTPPRCTVRNKEARDNVKQPLMVL